MADLGKMGQRPQLAQRAFLITLELGLMDPKDLQVAGVYYVSLGDAVLMFWFMNQRSCLEIETERRKVWRDAREREVARTLVHLFLKTTGFSAPLFRESCIMITKSFRLELASVPITAEKVLMKFTGGYEVLVFS